MVRYTHMTEVSGPNDLSRELAIAKRLYQVVIKETADAGGVNAETAIASVSRMAGMYLLLSFGFDLSAKQPGEILLSESANQKGPELIRIVSRVLGAAKVTISADEFGKEVPEKNKPHLSLKESEQRLSAGFADIAKELSADQETMARASAVTAGLLITDTQEVLDPTIGLTIAAYGFVEGAKTVPFYDTHHQDRA